MRICIPVARDFGLESATYGHFGSAPCFLVVDSETLEVQRIENSNHQHQHGACNPVGVIAGQSVDAAIVGGIGRRALMALQSAGVDVLRFDGGTVAEAIEGLKQNRLSRFGPDDSCGGHEHGQHRGGCRSGI
jgi:predicted Fe-Mo cluster-binding NifX family protein